MRAHENKFNVLGLLIIANHVATNQTSHLMTVYRQQTHPRHKYCVTAQPEMWPSVNSTDRLAIWSTLDKCCYKWIKTASSTELYWHRASAMWTVEVTIVRHSVSDVHISNIYPLLKQMRVAVKLKNRLVSCCDEIVVMLLLICQVQLTRWQLTATCWQLSGCVGKLLLCTPTL